MRTGNRLGSLTQSIVWLTAGNRSTVEPSCKKMPHATLTTLTLKGLEVMTHQRDARRGSFANMPKLRFLEISGDPEGTRIDQCQQLLAFIHIGSRAGVDIRQISVNRGEDFGVAKIEIRRFQICLSSRGISDRCRIVILCVLHITKVNSLRFIELRLAGKLLLSLDLCRLRLLKLCGRVVDRRPETLTDRFRTADRPFSPPDCP